MSLFGKRIFEDIIKELEMRPSCLVWVSPKSMTSILIRVTRRIDAWKEKRRSCEEEAEIGVTVTKTKAYQELEEERKDFPGLLEEAWSC